MYTYLCISDAWLRSGEVSSHPISGRAEPGDCLNHSVVFFVFVIYLIFFVLLEPGNCLVVWLINDDHYHLIVYFFIFEVSLDLFLGYWSDGRLKWHK